MSEEAMWGCCSECGEFDCGIEHNAESEELDDVEVWGYDDE